MNLGGKRHGVLKRMILLTVIVERSKKFFDVRSCVISTYSSLAKILYESIDIEADALA
jgi:hypothetical protein